MASSSKTIDTVPDHLKCPICMDIPKDKVFQCVNGHPICGDCSSQLIHCPQCRVPFGPQQIRNLVMENMLDDLTLECTFKASGCQRTVDRKSFQNHLRSCCYNTARFGPLVNVCQLLFGTNCAFQMNKGNGLKAIQHFRKDHRAVKHNSDNIHVTFSGEYMQHMERVLTRTRSTYIPAELLNVGNKGNQRSPAILKGNNGQHFFLILRIPSKDNRILSLASFFFREPHSGDHPFDKEDEGSASSLYKVKCSVIYDNKDCLTWSMTPVDILTVKKLPLYYAMPMGTFIRKFSEDKKVININMRLKKIKKAN